MGKESRIRQERKLGLIEKPAPQKRDRTSTVLRVIAIILIVVLLTGGTILGIRGASGEIAYQVGSGTVLQSDIDARVQNYIDMYKQYGMDLTSSEYASTLNSIRKSVIDASIEQELFLQYAKSKNMTPDPAKLKTSLDTEVDNAVKQSQEQFGTDTQAFNDAVVAQFGSMDKYKEKLREQLQPYVEKQLLVDAVTAEVEGKVSVTDADVKSYFTSVGRVNAEHLLIIIDSENDSASTIAAKKKEAQSIYDDIIAEKQKSSSFDFAKYAQEKAAELNKETPDSARYEALGFFTKGQMVKEFETAAFAAKVGDIVGPVQTEFGFHIIHKIAEEPVSSIYDAPETVKALHIVFGFGTGDQTAGAKAAEALANKVYAELQKGLSFKTAITKYSTDSDAKTGGVLDYFSETGDDIRFNALKGLKVGQYSKPIVYGSSYEILQLVDRKPFVKASLTDKTVYDKVKTALEDERKADAKAAFIAQLKEQFPVRQGTWSRLAGWFNRGPGKVFSAIGQWIVKATGKGETTSGSSDTVTPSAQ